MHKYERRWFKNNKGNRTDSIEFQRKSSSGGLSKDAIAGIIIAVCVLLIANTILVLYVESLILNQLHYNIHRKIIQV